jgi:hypothetical protein
VASVGAYGKLIEPEFLDDLMVMTKSFKPYTDEDAGFHFRG